MEKSPYIDQVMLYNNQSNYTTAVVVPNRDQLTRTLKVQNLDLTTEDGRKAALKVLDGELNKIKKGG